MRDKYKFAILLVSTIQTLNLSLSLEVEQFAKVNSKPGCRVGLKNFQECLFKYIDQYSVRLMSH